MYHTSIIETYVSLAVHHQDVLLGVQGHIIDILRQYYSFYMSITFVYTAKGKQVTQYMSLIQSPVTYKWTGRREQGYIARKKQQDHKLPMPGEKAKLEGSRSV